MSVTSVALRSTGNSHFPVHDYPIVLTGLADFDFLQQTLIAVFGGWLLCAANVPFG